MEKIMNKQFINTERPEIRRLNRALALYIKSALNRVPLVEKAPLTEGNPQSIQFTLPNCNYIDFVCFYLWLKKESPLLQEGSSFLYIRYKNQLPVPYSGNLPSCAQNFSFTASGETKPYYKRLPGDYELIDYVLYELNRKNPDYFPSFPQFERDISKNFERR